MPDAAPLGPDDPASLGQYVLIGRLGTGGQGTVYLGHTPTDEHVAIKLLHAQMVADPTARARFAREVEAAQKVSAFCTARLLEYEMSGDQPYIVSEFIDGPSLYDVVTQNGPRTGTALERLAIGTVTALAAIHEAGVVHRDFKPQNVLLAADGPRVVDFGIARTVNSKQSLVTATGMVIGTPGYLAPEQLTGDPLTAAVDIFAWGTTMVFAATGRSPFEADTLPVVITRILHEQPDLSALSDPLREPLTEALAKDPARRPAAPELLLRLLGHVGAAPAAADLLDKGTEIAAQMPPPPAVAPAPPPPRPHLIGPSVPQPMPAGLAGPGPWAHPVQTDPTASHGPYQTPGYPARGRLSPGPVLAAVGIAVVLIVVVPIIVFVAMRGQDPTPPPNSPRPTATGTSATSAPGAALPRSFVGTWTGTGSNEDESGSYDITITLAADGALGRVEYPRCSGVLRVLESSSDEVQFHELITRGTDQCLVSGYVTLTQTDSTHLEFEIRRFESDDNPVATGRLTKNR